MIEKNERYFEMNFPITYYQMEHNKTLKPSALLNCLQDLATIAAEKLNFGYTAMVEKNLGWFLIKYRMEFEEYPVNFDEVKIITEARGVSKLMAHRDFEIYSKDEKLLGRVFSHWLVVDMSTRGIASVKEAFPQMPMVVKREDDLAFDKIRPSEDFDNEVSFKIRYDDLDVNEHVNNSNYITWALESLTYDFRSSHRIKNLDMYYKKEMRYGGNVLSQVKIDGENLITTHVLKCEETGDEVCLVKAEWTL